MISKYDVFETLQNALVEAIDDSSYGVILEDQTQKRPSGAYCTIKVVTITSQSLEQKVKTNLDGSDNVNLAHEAMYTVFVSFKFFKEVAMDMAGKVRRRLVFDSVMSILEAGGLGLSERGSVKNLTLKIENGFEDRAGFTAMFNAVESDAEEVSTINEVTVDGEYTPKGDDTSTELELDIKE